MKPFFPFLLLCFSAKIYFAQSPNFQVFPNPFSQQLNFSFHLDSASIASIQFFDLSGRNVALALPDTQLASDNHQFSAQLNYLNAGVYIVALNYNSNKQVVKVLKMDNATFICPIGNLYADTVRFQITVADSLGDTISYHIYNRWGAEVAGFDTVLQPGNYSFEFVLDSLARGTYFQRFVQDTNSCNASIFLVATSLPAISEQNFSIQKSGSYLTIHSNENLDIKVFNHLGQVVVEAKENSIFSLSEGLHFITVENRVSKQFQVVKWWQWAE
jgi:hypothetical protein